MASSKNQYHPESASHPGFILAEKLEEMNMGPKEFSVRTGKPEKTISAILSGKSSITPEMAVLFEDVLKIPAQFWMNFQKLHDEGIARVNRKAAIMEAREWARCFPYAPMVKMGWVPATRKIEEKVEHLFRYFRISSQKAFEDFYFRQRLKVSFRISLAHTKKPYAFAAWLRQGEIQARELEAGAYRAGQFEKSLDEIKKLMADHPDNFFRQLQNICLRSGVKLVYTPCLPGAAVHGSTRWIRDTPLIQLSARYRQNDIFWFTFFHEAGHILKHGRKYVSIENVDYDDQDEKKEAEADAFAVQWTFSEDEERMVLKAPRLTEDTIRQFAREFNTHPAMIIGRFHHKELLPYSMGRQFIEPIDLSDSEG